MMREKINSKIRNLREKEIVNFSVLKNFIALTFLYMGAIVMAPLSKESVEAKVLLTLYSFIILVLSLFLIFEAINKTLLVNEKDLKDRYRQIALLNLFFGVSIPLIYSKYLFEKVIFDYLSKIPSSNSVISSLKNEFLLFYINANISELFDILIKASLIALVVLLGYWISTKAK